MSASGQAFYFIQAVNFKNKQYFYKFRAKQSRNDPSLPINWERQAVLAFRTIWLDSGAQEL